MAQSWSRINQRTNRRKNTTLLTKVNYTESRCTCKLRHRSAFQQLSLSRWVVASSTFLCRRRASGVRCVDAWPARSPENSKVPHRPPDRPLYWRMPCRRTSRSRQRSRSDWSATATCQIVAAHRRTNLTVRNYSLRCVSYMYLRTKKIETGHVDHRFHWPAHCNSMQ